MAKEYSWAEVRERAAEVFGRYPDAELEQKLLDVFRDRPAFVVDAIEEVSGAFQAGRIHSPWLLLAKQVQRSPLELVVSDESEKERKLAWANQWIRTVGLHYDRWSEVEQVLFGDAELTAPLEVLEGLERETRDAPGRVYYGSLLKASIARTKAVGREQIQAAHGVLGAWDSPELRAEMRELYEQVRPAGFKTELEMLARMEAYKAQRERQKVRVEEWAAE